MSLPTPTRLCFCEFREVVYEYVNEIKRVSRAVVGLMASKWVEISSDLWFRQPLDQALSTFGALCLGLNPPWSRRADCDLGGQITCG